MAAFALTEATKWTTDQIIHFVNTHQHFSSKTTFQNNWLKDPSFLGEGQTDWHGTIQVWTGALRLKLCCQHWVSWERLIQRGGWDFFRDGNTTTHIFWNLFVQLAGWLVWHKDLFQNSKPPLTIDNHIGWQKNQISLKWLITLHFFEHWTVYFLAEWWKI